MIRLRKECPEIGWGDCSILPTRTSSTFAIAHHWRGNMLVCVNNFSDQLHAVKLRLGDESRQPLINLIDDSSIAPDRHHAYELTVEPYGHRWYRLNTPNRRPSEI